MTAERARRSWGVAITVVVAAFMGSCNILQPAAYLAMGQAKAPAKYVLEDTPTVVFVDDRNNAIPINSSRVRRAVADDVTKQLMSRDLVTMTISPRDAMALSRNQDREGKLMSMGALGEAIGAEQLIYIEMLSYRGSPDNVTPRPSAACRLKVIDVVNKTRVLPGPDAEKAWQEIIVQGPPVSPELYRSSAGRREIEQLLAAAIADKVTKLFYKHIPDELGSRLTPQ
jgi:hypothetical protein